MYNGILRPLLDNDPRKTITKFGIKMRQFLYPLFKKVVPLTIKRKLILVSRAEIPQKPTIFVSTHEFREDCEAAYLAAGRQSYLVNGCVDLVMNTKEGITNWLVGIILVDRADKSSRKALKDKMVYALKKGGNILIYPEGTWNKSPNQVISGLFPGVYEVAKESSARIIPIANHREEDAIYSIVGSSFDVSGMNREEAMETIKERLSTLRYELIEKFGSCKREKLPSGKELESFWSNNVDALMAEVPYYDYELERHTKYREKGVVQAEEAYSFFRKIKPSKATAFLFRDNVRWWG